MYGGELKSVAPLQNRSDALCVVSKIEVSHGTLRANNVVFFYNGPTLDTTLTLMKLATYIAKQQ